MRRLTLTIFLVLASFGAGIVVTRYHFHRTVRAAPIVVTVPTTTSQLTAPVLRENFTLLACNANTTIGQEGCAEHKIVSLDRQINRLSGEVVKHLSDKAAKRRFVTAEIDWHTYRQSTCASDSDKYEGGSLAPVEFANCVVRVNEQHVAALTNLLASY